MSVRAEKAQANRQRMRAAAQTLFTSRGYSATSMQAIADEAGMAVQTLYFTFRTKRALLSELLDVAIAGDDEPVPTLERPRVLAAINNPDPVVQLPGEKDEMVYLPLGVGIVHVFNPPFGIAAFATRAVAWLRR